ncbi:MAG: hypothetical protein ACLTOV_00075 [Phocaeicola sp.]
MILYLDTAKENGKRIFHSTKIDRFLASFSGGKDSQVVLDLAPVPFLPQTLK